MHPAPSVIIFTALSGLGFGMLVWLGIGLPDVTGWVAFIFYFVAYALAVGGLLASTFHLGNPQRALLAFSQWRTSWLSREAWLSVLCLTLIGLYAASAIFLGVKLPVLGGIGAALALATVFSTSMIYTQMKTVPRWHNRTTPLMFMLYSISGGALLAGQTSIAAVLLLVTGAAQLWAWREGDTSFGNAGSTLETATGLGPIGKVRQYEPPHTGTNYLLSEMVYVVGRKHAARLRVIAILLCFVVPALLLGFASGAHILALVAVIFHLAGLFVSRWLFFAQAEHVVGLYYDKR